MILLSDDPREPQCRQRLIDILGQEDATVLVQWLWDRHRPGGNPTFGQALAAITMQTDQHGPQFARNLLDFAKKPRHVAEAEMEIMAWIKPRIEAAAAKVAGHRGDPDVAKAEFDILCYGLNEKLWNMYPHKHRATMKGAIVSSFEHKGGAFSLNVASLVKALEMDDPLKATARQSRLAG
jgi:hypothetical protein